MKKGLIFLIALFIGLELCIGKATSAASSAIILFDKGANKGVGDLELVRYDADFIDLPHVQAKRYRIIRPICQNGVYQFKLDSLDSPAFFMIREATESDGRTLLKRGLIEPGDRITISNQMNGLVFSGKGAAKVELLFNMDKYFAYFRDSLNSDKLVTSIGNSWMNELQDLIVKSSEIRRLFRERIRLMRDGDYVKAILLAETTGYVQLYVDRICLLEFIHNKRFTPSQLDTLNTYRKFYACDLEWVDDSAKAISSYWIKYVMKKAELDFVLSGKESSLFEHIVKSCRGAVRERLLTHYLLSSGRSQANYRVMVIDALSYIENQYYRSEILSLSKILRRGAKAPIFRLLDHNDEPVRLTDFKGKVVFLDFWFVGCSACSFYYKNAIVAAKEKFGANDDLVFISICIERDKQKWEKAVDKGVFTSQTSVNLYTGTYGWKHPVIQQYGLMSAPTPFLIGKDGVFFSLDGEELGRRNPSRLIETIEECLFIRVD